MQLLKMGPKAKSLSKKSSTATTTKLKKTLLNVASASNTKKATPSKDAAATKKKPLKKIASASNAKKSTTLHPSEVATTKAVAPAPAVSKAPVKRKHKGYVYVLESDDGQQENKDNTPANDKSDGTNKRPKLPKNC